MEKIPRRAPGLTLKCAPICGHSGILYVLATLFLVTSSLCSSQSVGQRHNPRKSSLGMRVKTSSAAKCDSLISPIQTHVQITGEITSIEFSPPKTDGFLSVESFSCFALNKMGTCLNPHTLPIPFFNIPRVIRLNYEKTTVHIRECVEAVNELLNCTYKFLNVPSDDPSRRLRSIAQTCSYSSFVGSHKEIFLEPAIKVFSLLDGGEVMPPNSGVLREGIWEYIESDSNERIELWNVINKDTCWNKVFSNVKCYFLRSDCLVCPELNYLPLLDNKATCRGEIIEKPTVTFANVTKKLQLLNALVHVRGLGSGTKISASPHSNFSTTQSVIVPSFSGENLTSNIALDLVKRRLNCESGSTIFTKYQNPHYIIHSNASGGSHFMICESQLRNVTFETRYCRSGAEAIVYSLGNNPVFGVVEGNGQILASGSDIRSKCDRRGYSAGFLEEGISRDFYDICESPRSSDYPGLIDLSDGPVFLEKTHFCPPKTLVSGW